MDRRLGRALPSLGACRGHQTPDQLRISAETSLLGHWVVAVTPGCHAAAEAGASSPWKELVQVRPEGSSVPCTPDPNAPPASGELQGRHLRGRPFPAPDLVLLSADSFVPSCIRVRMCSAGLGLEEQPGWAGPGGGTLRHHCSLNAWTYGRTRLPAGASVAPGRYFNINYGCNVSTTVAGVSTSWTCRCLRQPSVYTPPQTGSCCCWFQLPDENTGSEGP